jgi:hypothetical protein
MFNKPTSEGSLFNKSLCLTPALGVTKFTIDIDIILVHFVVLLKLNLMFINKPTSEASLLNKSLYLTPALGVTKFTIVTKMILVTLCCAT